jgi:transcriptional repressor NrdR
VKKDGEKEPFDRDKIKRGLAKACWKRPVTEDDIEGVITTLETELYGAYESELPSGVLGARLMELLRHLDQVAYVRFASVYREFKDVRDFVDELEPILAESYRSQQGTKSTHSGGAAAPSDLT